MLLLDIILLKVFERSKRGLFVWSSGKKKNTRREGGVTARLVPTSRCRRRRRGPMEDGDGQEEKSRPENTASPPRVCSGASPSSSCSNNAMSSDPAWAQREARPTHPSPPPPPFYFPPPPPSSRAKNDTFLGTFYSLFTDLTRTTFGLWMRCFYLMAGRRCCFNSGVV